MAAVLTLREAIDQLVNLGEKDPVEIAALLLDRYGEKWLASESAALGREVVVWLARDALGRSRRNVQPGRLPLRRATPVALLLQAKWVPEVGWKKIGDLTADDCRAIADHYRLLAASSLRYANFYDELAALIEVRGAAKASEVAVEQWPQLELEAA